MSLLLRSTCLSSFRILLNKPTDVPVGYRILKEAACVSYLHNKAGQLKSLSQQQRHQHTAPFNVKDLPIWQRFKWKLGFFGHLQVPSTRLTRSAYNLFVSCTDLIDLTELMKDLKLPDTFNSWFLLLQVHLWLVNVKLSQMGKEGALLKTYLYNFMWRNIEQRLETYKDLNAKERRQALEQYYNLMLLSIMYYDEGLLGSDKDLANALWINLFSQDASIDTDRLELMVKYIRKQVHHHESLDNYLIMFLGYISFLPLHQDTLDSQKQDRNIQYLSDR